MVEISVVIPTYNRLGTLMRCLRALDEQTLNRARYEIIVVDDGSTDGTAAALAGRLGVRCLHQPRNAGLAAARNVGIRAAAGRYVLFLGDDIVARPSLLEQHLAAHGRAPGDHIAVLGDAPWSAVEQMSPLTRYLTAGGALQQFRAPAAADLDNLPFGSFDTCNLSLSRDFLLRHGLFDEDFRHAVGEDTELAYRLRRHGMRIVFRKEIAADHSQPTSYRSARSRTRVAGAAGLLMSRKHPELSEVGVVRSERLTARLSIRVKRSVTEAVIDPLLDFADRRRWDHPLLARAYEWALREHRIWGLMDAAAQSRPPRAQARPAIR
jgi:GT2 family glycosyltransferase